MPHLCSVFVTHSQPGGRGVRVFATSNFPSLTSITATCGVYAQDVLYLRKGNWQSRIDLDLSRSDLNAAAMTYLVKGSWTNLTHLSLSGSHIDAAAVSVFCKGSWSNLQALYLSNNVLGAAGIEHLVNGNWQSLQTLTLKNTALDLCALCHLCRGQWPHLSFLNLTTNKLDAHIKVLKQGDWPQLHALLISCSELAQDAYKVLGVTDVRDQFKACRAGSPRKLLRTDRTFWPHLATLTLC